MCGHNVLNISISEPTFACYGCGSEDTTLAFPAIAKSQSKRERSSLLCHLMLWCLKLYALAQKINLSGENMIVIGAIAMDLWQRKQTLSLLELSLFTV